MGALRSLVLEGKVTSFFYYKFPWTILVICLSFWAELKNFDRNFGDGILDDCRRHYDKRTFAQSPSGKPPETLEPKNAVCIILTVFSSLQWLQRLQGSRDLEVPKLVCPFFWRLVDFIEMEQLFDNPFTSPKPPSKNVPLYAKILIGSFQHNPGSK